jgi:hypothetical protein
MIRRLMLWSILAGVILVIAIVLHIPVWERIGLVIVGLFELSLVALAWWGLRRQKNAQ